MFDKLIEISSNPYLIGIVVYLLALVGVGFIKARSVKNSEDFMVAGRTLPWYVLVGTLLATWMGNGSLFGGAGLGYRNGLAGLWMNVGAWVGIVLVFFIAKRIRNFGKVTIPEIFQARYGGASAALATVATAIAYLTIVSYQFKGGGRVLAIVTDGAITEHAGLVLTAIFAILYTVLAGMLSVVYTDVVNGVIMTAGVLLGLGYLVVEVGGVETVIETADAVGKMSLFGHWDEESESGASAALVAISFCIPTMLLLLGDANMYQRIFSARDSGAARKAVFFWVIGVIILETAIHAFGLAGSVAVSQGTLVLEESENVIPVTATQIMPLALGLLLVASMMAIIVSTADSFLLVPATNLVRDVYQKVVNPDATERFVVALSRILIVVLGVFGYLLAGQFEKILDASYVAYLIYGTSIAPALLAAFLWKRATAAGAVASIVLGSTVTLVWTFVLPEIDALNFKEWPPFFAEVTYPAAGISILALVVVSLLSSAPPREKWEPFFDES